MMFEGKHIHFSPVDKKPLCSYSAKLCKQRRINGYGFCIRHILEDKSAPFKQCAHVARYNKQKCTNPIPSNENREFCNSHMQVAGILPKKLRKNKKEKSKEGGVACDGKLKFADRLRALLKKESSISCNEDPFNSDDPYAFPDPANEQENGCIGYSPSLSRNVWTCSPRVCYDSPSSDLPLKCDQLSKSSSFLDVKNKSNSPKLSETMNRLHAKIAQNKILDKQKKTQDSSQTSVPVTNINFHAAVSNIKLEPLSPVEVSNASCDLSSTKRCTDLMKHEATDVKAGLSGETTKSEQLSICSDNSSTSPLPCSEAQSSHIDSCSPVSSSHRALSPSSSDSVSKGHSEYACEKESSAESYKIPQVLLEVCRIFNGRKRRSRDFFPLGFESSESEGSESEEEEHLFSQLSWFSASDWQNFDYFTDDSLGSRQFKRLQLRGELQRSYQHLCYLHRWHMQETCIDNEQIQPLVDAAHSYPNQASSVMMNQIKSPAKKRVEEKQRQCYKKNGEACSLPALPYTWHCQKHVLYNVDQLVFKQCTAKYPDDNQCCVPVFDFGHEMPLCMEHTEKKDNYQRMTLDSKPKKPRKKPKPSALTRPPKRGKKKRKSNLLRPVSPAPHLPEPSSALSNSSSSSEFREINLDNQNGRSVRKTARENKSSSSQMNSELDSDLEDQFSPGAIEKSLELPLDAAELANQATKLLEEHDFTDVLNKLPDDAFNDLFVETRNGEYFPSKEETEELERALAAVSKDVHLAKVSLAKLSSGSGPDLEELEQSIDIHGSLLGAENLTSAIDENAFPELSNSLNVMTSSFSTGDLGSFTRALSGITSENIEQSHLPTTSDRHLTQSSVTTVPLMASDVTHPHMLNGHTAVAGMHSLHVDPSSPHLLDNGLNSGIPDGTSDGRLVSTSHLATLLYGLNQVSTHTTSQTSFTNSSNIAENSGLMSTSGGLASSPHWLLNSSSDQILSLSHMPYQNGFIVASQTGTPYGSTLLASVAKYPLQSLSAEVSLVSSSSSLIASSCSESGAEHPMTNMNLPNRTLSLKANSSTAVIAQEGAS